jgi:ubiquinone/menaquinone biosynthesis C-methylase UbiE
LSSSELKTRKRVRRRVSVAKQIPRTAAQLKDAFRARWSLPERVAGWTSGGLNTEFGHAGCRRAWMDTLHQAVAGGPQRTALDIGTGPGTIAQLWAELGFKVSGFDFAPPMVEAARRGASDKGLDITFVEGDAEDPPFADLRFDVISSRFVLFTLPHPGYSVRRWVEMLHPGGRLVLIGHERPEGAGPPQQGHRHQPAANGTPTNPIDERHREALRELPFMDHTPGDLRVVMEAVGLRDIERAPVDKLLAARAALQKRMLTLELPRSTPFILVGRR